MSNEVNEKIKSFLVALMLGVDKLPPPDELTQDDAKLYKAMYQKGLIEFDLRRMNETPTWKIDRKSTRLNSSH